MLGGGEPKGGGGFSFFDGLGGGDKARAAPGREIERHPAGIAGSTRHLRAYRRRVDEQFTARRRAGPGRIRAAERQRAGDGAERVPDGGGTLAHIDAVAENADRRLGVAAGVGRPVGSSPTCRSSQIVTCSSSQPIWIPGSAPGVRPVVLPVAVSTVGG